MGIFYTLVARMHTFLTHPFFIYIVKSTHAFERMLRNASKENFLVHGMAETDSIQLVGSWVHLQVLRHPSISKVLLVIAHAKML